MAKPTRKNTPNQRAETPSVRQPHKAQATQAPAQSPAHSPAVAWSERPYVLLPALDLKWQAIIVLLFGFLLYINTVPNDYAVDDLIAISENNFTKEGFGGISSHLTTDSFEGYFGKRKDLLSGGRYRPLSLITFAVEWGLFGENPHISHTINALLYALLGLILLSFLRKTILRAQPEAAFLATLIFLFHPIHTEVVANLKGRDELLSVLFLLPALAHFVRFAENRQMKPLLYACGLLFLSLLSKENAFMVLALLPLTLWVSTRMPAGHLLRFTLPAAGVLVLYFMVRVALTGMPGGGGSTDVLNNPYIYAEDMQGFATKVAVLGQYLLWLVWPFPLSWDYSYPQIEYVGMSSPVFLLSLVVHLGLLYGLVVGAVQKRSVWGWAIGWYLFSLFIVSNLLVNIGAFQGERFLFQPSLGFAVFVAWGLVTLAGTMAAQPAVRWGLLGTLALVFAASTGWTLTRNTHWESNETLYIHDVEVATRSAKTNLGAGEAYFHKAALDSTSGYSDSQKQEYYQKAIQYFDKALQLYPMFNDAFLRKGLTYIFMDKNDSAAAALANARQLYPDNDKLLKYQAVLGNRYHNQGVKYRERFLDALQNQQLDTAENYARLAIDWNRKAVDADPHHHTAWSELGGLYGEVSMFDSSFYAFGQATQLKPEHEPYWFGMGISFLRGGEAQRAIAPLERALQLNPNNPQTKAALNDARQRAAGIPTFPNNSR